MLDKIKGLNEAVVSIWGQHSGNPSIHIGSGFIIAGFGRSAIVCTAGHVVKGCADFFQKEKRHTNQMPIPPGEEQENFILNDDSNVLIHAGENSGMLSGNVFAAFCFTKADLGIMFVRADENSPDFTEQINISTTFPGVGSEVYSMGYNNSFDTTLTSALVPDLLGNVLKSHYGYKEIQGNLSGHIPSTVMTHNERGLVPAPTFTIDTPLHSGVSGGPVIQMIEGTPVVVGINSSDSGGSSVDILGNGESANCVGLAPIIDLSLEGQSGEVLEIISNDKDGKEIAYKVQSIRSLSNVNKIKIV